MSRFDNDWGCDEAFPNQAELWHANVQRALTGKRGRKALAELREALRALPEKRPIAGALCTVGGLDRPDLRNAHQWTRENMEDKLQHEGEGVCVIGAYLWFKKVKAGAVPRTAFEELPILLDVDGDGDTATADAGQQGGLTYTLAWSLACRNDEQFEAMTPEGRYDAFMAWLDEKLGEEPAPKTTPTVPAPVEHGEAA